MAELRKEINNLPTENEIDKLPNESLERIFSYLALKDLSKVLRVEHRWNHLLKNNRRFFKNKFGLSKRKTKMFISNIADKSLKNAYLSKAITRIFPEDLKNRDDLSTQFFISSRISSEMTYEIEELLLKKQGKAALIEGWIKVHQAIKFTPKMLSILLFKAYPSMKREINPEQLVNILNQSELRCIINDTVLDLEKLLELLFDEKYSIKIASLGWNKKELIDLFYRKVKTLLGALQYDEEEIKNFFPLTELAKIKETTAVTLFTKKGMESLKEQNYTLSQILYAQEGEDFAANFNLVLNNDVGLALLKNKKLTFERLMYADTKVLTKLLTNKTCYIALNHNLIPLTSGLNIFSEIELEKYCENVLSGLSEGLFEFNKVINLVINKPQLFIDFILSKEGLFLLRKKEFSLDNLDSYLSYRKNNNNNSHEDRDLAIAIQNSLDSSNKLTERVSPIFTLLKTDQLITLTAADFRLLNQEDIIDFLVRLKPAARELINIKNLTKVLHHPKGLYALKNNIITLSEIQSEAFDGDVDLSISMFNAINNSLSVQVTEDNKEEDQDENSDIDETEDLDKTNDSDNDFDDSSFSKFGSKTP